MFSRVFDTYARFLVSVFSIFYAVNLQVLQRSAKKPGDAWEEAHCWWYIYPLVNNKLGACHCWWGPGGS